MNKTFKLYGILFIIVIAVLAVLQLSKKETLDWRKNFDPTKKTPFGLFVFSEESKKLVSDTLKKAEVSPYKFFENKQFKPRNYLFINRYIDDESSKKLLNEVAKGSDLMIISDEVYGYISDSLKVGEVQELNFDESNTLKLTDDRFKNNSLVLDKVPGRFGFSLTNKGHQVLGSVKGKKNMGAAFVKMNYGKGNIYYHTEPLFITNYYLLKSGNEKYAEAVFSYLPNRETVWFGDSHEFESKSILRFILANSSLKYAWWLLLGGLVLFVFFNVKRKQRIVPIIEPLKNKSVEFVKSIGNLYLQEGDFHDMMSKKAHYFLHKVRIDLLIDTQNIDDEFAKKLQVKTGISQEKINEAIELMKKGMDPYASVMKEDLVKMNKLLDEILK